MEKKFGELEQIIIDYITQAINNGTYTITLTDKYIGSDGYFGGSITIGGCVFRVSFNKKGYICWHTEWEELFKAVKGAEKKFLRDAIKMVKFNEKEAKKERIKQLQEEINKLKKK